MTLAAKDVRALNRLPVATSFEEIAGPAVAAMVLPATMIMTGWMALWGVGFGFARAFAGMARTEAGEAPAVPAATVVPLKLVEPPAAPRLVVSNPKPAVTVAPKVKAAPKPKARAVAKVKAPAVAKVAAKPVAKAVPPKVAETAAVVPTAEAPPVPMPTIEAVKPAPAKPAAPGAPPKLSKPGGSLSKPKSATPDVVEAKAAAKPAATKPAAVKAAPAKTAAKPVPAKAAPLKIETTSNPKGISLPKVSMQDKSGEEPGGK